MVGNAERGPLAIEAIRNHQAVCLMAVDSRGTSVHHSGHKEWPARIAGIPILQ
jgi:hypothetical protein